MKSTNIYQTSTPVISLKVVGFLDFKTGKIYKHKARLLIAENKRKETPKAAKEIFLNDFANILRGEGLRERLLKAKKLISNWTFARYSELLTCLRLLRVFNSSVDSCFRVYI